MLALWYDFREKATDVIYQRVIWSVIESLDISEQFSTQYSDRWVNAILPPSFSSEERGQVISWYVGSLRYHNIVRALGKNMGYYLKRVLWRFLLFHPHSYVLTSSILPEVSQSYLNWNGYFGKSNLTLIMIIHLGSCALRFHLHDDGKRWCWWWKVGYEICPFLCPWQGVCKIS